MVVIKSVYGETILDSRGKDAISLTIKTSLGEFSASAPNGKSKGKNEKKDYRKNILEEISEIKKLELKLAKEEINYFEDLEIIERIFKRKIGANSLLALEYACLKAISKQSEKPIWNMFNKKTKSFPIILSNIIGGGLHTSVQKKPDFQEFLFASESPYVRESFIQNVFSKEEAFRLLKKADTRFDGKENDEKAWITSLEDKRVLEVLRQIQLKCAEEKRIESIIGIDAAASSIYSRKKYSYSNPVFQRDKEEQFNYVSNLIQKFGLGYIEDPFEEEDFESFSRLLKEFPKALIVGDDLTATNLERVKSASKKRAVNAIIVKPNQIGSLLEVKKICDFAKEVEIQTIFSHRSGETPETILADLSVAFEANLFKCGSGGDIRESKIKRLIEIQEKEI